MNLKKLHQEFGKKVAIISVDELGRSVNINGRRFDVFDIAYEQNSNLDAIFDEDEDEYNQLIKTVEDNILRNHHVTHVVDPESFGDNIEHPVEEYLSQ